MQKPCDSALNYTFNFVGRILFPDAGALPSLNLKVTACIGLCTEVSGISAVCRIVKN